MLVLIIINFIIIIVIVISYFVYSDTPAGLCLPETDPVSQLITQFVYSFSHPFLLSVRKIILVIIIIIIIIVTKAFPIF